MESIHNIFTATLKENKENPQFLVIIHDLVYELSRKKVQRLKDEKNIQSRLSELFEMFAKALETEELNDTKTLGCVVDGIIKASSSDKEEFLYKTIYEKEQLEKSIYDQKKAIRDTIQSTFYTLESHIEAMDEETAKIAHHALNDSKLRGVEMLGILKETTSEALLTTLEKAVDVEDTIFEITKNITYQAINEGDFTKQRFLNISSSIIEVTIEIADEDQAFAKELLHGAIHGTKEGMAKAIEKFKNDLKFAPEELEEILEKDLRSAKKELIRIEESFIHMLENIVPTSNGVSAKIISDILEEEFKNSFAKVRRVANEASEVISDKIEELRENASHLEHNFVEKAGSKFDSLKKEMHELEEKASKKVEAIKGFEFENENARKAANEAKRLGNRAWEVAKSMVDGAVKGAKEAMKKDDKDESK